MGCQGAWKQCQGELRQDCQPQVWWRGWSCVWRRMYSCWKCRNDVPQCSKPGSQGTCQENCQGNRKNRSLSLKPNDSVIFKTPSKNALIINISSVLKCKQNVMLLICFNKLCLYLISSATTIYNKITILHYLTMNDEINIFHVARTIICFIFNEH